MDAHKLSLSSLNRRYYTSNPLVYVRLLLENGGILE